MTSHPDAASGRAYRVPVSARPTALLATLGLAVVTALVPVVDLVLPLPSGQDLAGSAQALAGFAGDAIESIKAAGSGLHGLAAGAESRLNLPLVVLVSLGAQVLLTAALVVTGTQPVRVMLTVAGLINVFAVARLGPASAPVWDAAANGVLVIALAWFSAGRREPRLAAL
ncbi:hypothetical protein DMH03_11185 [Amycolatopsis sp. WAC 01376]|uniref:hypothetical protein n=1 Tax=Amycolatopsis sp. WAC 01376 TaxID=2203195 RepID=UPI000F7AD80B|nr:hypothetical protein [Amycolatopsis sp. WAC 01376]RSM62632.1 hypothetical protein DMH03_11185 [Amycolatopsis sp. WAC 01376]